MRNNKNLYIVSGASGSGKSSCIPYLKNKLNDITIYDFDTIGVPLNADKAWRQESTELWLKKHLGNEMDTCLCGQVVLGEVLACPSAVKLSKINFCFLDCSDIVRIQRLKERKREEPNQDTLSWASWLRVHNNLPSWHQDVIKSNAWEGLNFSVWDKLEGWDNLINLNSIDTSSLSINEVANEIAKWIKELK